MECTGSDLLTNSRYQAGFLCDLIQSSWYNLFFRVPLGSVPFCVLASSLCAHQRRLAFAYKIGSNSNNFQLSNKTPEPHTNQTSLGQLSVPELITLIKDIGSQSLPLELGVKPIPPKQCKCFTMKEEGNGFWLNHHLLGRNFPFSCLMFPYRGTCTTIAPRAPPSPLAYFSLTGGWIANLLPMGFISTLDEANLIQGCKPWRCSCIPSTRSLYERQY